MKAPFFSLQVERGGYLGQMKRFPFLGLFAVGAAHAQAPVITTVNPVANARAAGRTAPVTVTFSQPLTAASAGALKVFSAQRGGLRTRGTTPAVVRGNALEFAPVPYPFVPGETVQYTVTTAAQAGAGALARPRVGQFTAAASGSGRGAFVAGASPGVGGAPTVAVLADLDSDGDLDLLAGNQNGNFVSVRFNDGIGVFAGGSNPAVTGFAQSLVVGDVDGDGDLDLLTASQFSNTVSVRLNDGSGGFGGGSDPVVGDGPYGVALGDVDGDGDLDLLTANGGVIAGTGNTVSVRLNNGSGVFSGGSDPGVGSSPIALAVGDVDGDGDLDLLTANQAANTVSVRLNNGNGMFSGGSTCFVGNGPCAVALGDVDGDNDLDVVTASAGNGSSVGNTASVRLNNGSGVFSGGSEIVVGSGPRGVALGDVDADGDLDLFTPNLNRGLGATVSVRLNDGSGGFSGGSDPNVGSIPQAVALGDVDGDGDLDLLTANGGPTMGLRLNGGTGLATTSAASQTLALFPNPARSRVAVTGAAPRASLAVVDALGREVLTTHADAAGGAVLALPPGLARGVYVVRTTTQAMRLSVE